MGLLEAKYGLNGLIGSNQSLIESAVVTIGGQWVRVASADSRRILLAFSVVQNSDVCYLISTPPSASVSPAGMAFGDHSNPFVMQYDCYGEAVCREWFAWTVVGTPTVQIMQVLLYPRPCPVVEL